MSSDKPMIPALYIQVNRDWKKINALSWISFFHRKELREENSVSGVRIGAGGGPLKIWALQPTHKAPSSREYPFNGVVPA